MHPLFINTQIVKQTALNLGFDFCGIAQAQELTADAKRLENWLNKGFNGNMKYMENYFDERINPAILVPNAQSVITLALNYFPSQQQDNKLPKIAKYAYGKDYHYVIKEKLNAFFSELQIKIGNITGRGFVDSAPVLERAWAVKSGLGWVGKNGNLIIKNKGSFFFLATLIIDVKLLYDDELGKDFCGTCTKCIDACPTNAILPNKEINGSQCISYYTIELKEAFEKNLSYNFNNWAFGCDICQDVCPWNKFSTPHKTPEFTPIPAIFNLNKKDWEEMNEETFKMIFGKSAIKRTKLKGMKRNIEFLHKN